MPSWNQSFNILVLLSIGGFSLLLVSGYWHVLFLLVIAAALAWLWGQNRRTRK
jgi:hypothetical protein